MARETPEIRALDQTKLAYYEFLPPNIATWTNRQRNGLLDNTARPSKQAGKPNVSPGNLKALSSQHVPAGFLLDQHSGDTISKVTTPPDSLQPPHSFSQERQHSSPSKPESIGSATFGSKAPAPPPTQSTAYDDNSAMDVDLEMTPSVQQFRLGGFHPEKSEAGTKTFAEVDSEDDVAAQKPLTDDKGADDDDNDEKKPKDDSESDDDDDNDLPPPGAAMPIKIGVLTRKGARKLIQQLAERISRSQQKPNLPMSRRSRLYLKTLGFLQPPRSLTYLEQSNRKKSPQPVELRRSVVQLASRSPSDLTTSNSS